MATTKKEDGSERDGAAVQEFSTKCRAEKLRQVFMDIDIDGQRAGRLVIQLSHDKCPCTCENFRSLCLGTGRNIHGVALSYKGTNFFSVVRGWVAKGGDNVNNNGTHGEGLYGRQMPTEPSALSHDSRGVVSMFNFELEPPRSQFFIMLEPGPWLDGEHVAFGKVVEGMDVLSLIEQQGTEDGRPKSSIFIAACGEITADGKEVQGKSAEEQDTAGNNLRTQKFVEATERNRPKKTSVVWDIIANMGLV